MFTQHPEILARVREEVIEALGSDGTPTLEDIRKLKYCTSLSPMEPEGTILKPVDLSAGCTS